MMGIQFDTAGNQCAQTRAGPLSDVEVLSKLIARIEAFDNSINVVAVRDFKERLC
jgi:Asp-tRNA(Asn)/Glu-tRNA(Gln) amidotransferase A subunit family amidase